MKHWNTAAVAVCAMQLRASRGVLRAVPQPLPGPGIPGNLAVDPRLPSCSVRRIAFVALSGLVLSQVIQSQQLPTLTTARQAHSLSNLEAQRGYPVHLKGVVTYFDPDYGTGYAAIFVHDSTGSIFVKPRSDSIMPVPAGTIVDVQGVSGPGGFGPIVVDPHLHAIGHAPLPPNPPLETLPRLETGFEDAQWVQVEGTVHAVLQYSHSVTLRLAMEGGTVSVTLLREPGEPYAPLVDAKIRIRANAAPTINSNGQMIGVHLMAPNLSAVSVVEPAPGDPFQRPPMPIDNLLHWDQLAASHHRVHLRGKVTLNWPGSSLCIQDATSGICVQTVQDTPLAAGDVVDVAGFAGPTHINEPCLLYANCHQAATRGYGHPLEVFRRVDGPSG